MQRFLLLAVLLLNGISQSLATNLPVWELGLGAGLYSSPHYLGADQSSTYALPLPLFIYRGSYVQADRSGLMGDLYRSDKLDLRLSASGSLPVNSDDNDAREDMPDLDLMFELGPILEYRFYDQGSLLLRVDLPLRMAVTIDKHGLEHRGWVSQPRLYARSLLAEKTVLIATLGPMFADEKYHDYFYQVKSQYVRPDRAEYDASAGFTAMRYSLSLSQFFGDGYVGGFVHFYDLHGAANRDSPLVKQKDYVSAGIAVGWTLKRSKTRVWRP